MSRSLSHASVFHAIADPTRRAVLDALRDGDLAVSGLLARIKSSQSALSQHLAVLRRAGLVKPRRVGRHRFYRVEPAPLREVVDWIAEYDKFWTDKLDHLGEYLDRVHGAAGRRAPSRP